MAPVFYIFIIGHALVFLGSFLPWASFVLGNVYGIEGDGKLTLILALIGVIVYFVVKNKPKLVSVATIIIGGLILVITVLSFVNLSKLTGVNFGGGLILTSLGSLAVIVSGFMMSRGQHNQT